MTWDVTYASSESKFESKLLFVFERPQTLNQTGWCPISVDNVWTRKLREAIEIKTERPTFNRDTGYDLLAIYDDLLSHNRP